MNATVTQTLISATLLRPSVRRWCAACGKEIGARMIRIAWKEGGSIYTAFYCPNVDEVDELRTCAPDHPLVRAALGRSA